MASPSPPPTPSWVILRKVTDVVSDGPQRAGFSVSRAPPPCLNRLTFYARADSNAAASAEAGDSPRVLAADLSAGLFLLNDSADAGYIVLDAAKPGVTCKVPARTGPDPGSLGIISAPGGPASPGFMVVGFEHQRPRVSNSYTYKAWLHYYLPGMYGGAGRWATKEVDNAETSRFWSFKDVIAHDGRIWWILLDAEDSSLPLLSCDPFADRPEMAFSTCAEHPLGLWEFSTRRKCHCVAPAACHCVQVADGKLRWVQILCQHMEGSRGGAPTVLMLTLDRPTDTRGWSDDHRRLSFADVWADPSYMETGLRKAQPAVALIDPDNPSVVYFSLDNCLFGVNMRTNKVEGHHLHGTPDSDVSASSLLACSCRYLPPALTAAPARRPPAPPSRSPSPLSSSSPSPSRTQVLDLNQQADWEASGNGGGAENSEEPEAKRRRSEI